MQFNGSIKAGRGGSWWVLLGILVLVAHASLFGVGPVGEDFRTLVEASRGVYPELGGEADGTFEVLFDRAGTGGRPLAAWSLGLSSWIWTSGGEWTPFASSGMRFENLVLLALVAHLLGRLLRRLLAPWTDSGQASAASNAVFMMLLVHPLSVSAVASPAARGDLIAAALAMFASLAFLKGRQERTHWLVALAAFVTAISTQASELGYLLPVWLGVIEFTSSRRYRPGHVRLRTGITTLIVFGAFAGSDVLLRVGLGFEDPWPAELSASLATLTSFHDGMVALLSGLTKLGVLILPVNGANAGAMGFVCGALLLVAVIQPALHAGLSAPRFWITLLCIWLALVLLAEAFRATLHVGPNDFSASAGLFPAVLVMAVGLSVASTAVSGSRRQGLPLLIAFLLCALARSNARGWRASAKDAREFSTQVAQVLEREGAKPRYFALDPPDLVDLFHATPENLAWMFDGASLAGGPRAEDLVFERMSEAAFGALARLEEFDRIRERGLVLVFANRRIHPSGPAIWVGERLRDPSTESAVLEWRNPVGEAGGADALFDGGHWVGPDGARPFVADSAGIELVTVRGAASAESEIQNRSTHPEIFWRARGGVVQGGRLEGVWFGAPGERQAVFDTGRSLDWLLGPRVDSLMLMGDLAESPAAEVWARPPAISGHLEPEIDGDDWHLGTPASQALEGLPGTLPGGDLDEEAIEEQWVLTLLDLESFEYEEIPCEVDEDGALSAPDAEEISQALRRAPGSLAWGIERRLGSVVIERSGGRL